MFPTHWQAQVILANSDHVTVTWNWSPTYHWRIAEAFDCLKDPTTYGSHCKGPTAVVHDAPGATNRKEKRHKMSTVLIYKPQTSCWPGTHQIPAQGPRQPKGWPRMAQEKKDRTDGAAPPKSSKLREGSGFSSLLFTALTHSLTQLLGHLP